MAREITKEKKYITSPDCQSCTYVMVSHHDSVTIGYRIIDFLHTSRETRRPWDYASLGLAALAAELVQEVLHGTRKSVAIALELGNDVGALDGGVDEVRLVFGRSIKI